MAMTKKDYLATRTNENPTIKVGTATAHNAWLNTFLQGSPLEKARFKPVKGKPGDAEYLKSNADNPLLVKALGDGKFEINILLPFALIAPTGVAMNELAAIAEFGYLADAITAGTLNPDSDEVIPAGLLETLADLTHQGWVERESWNKGKSEYDALAIPYATLSQHEKDKDRTRVKAVYTQLRKDWATLTD